MKSSTFNIVVAVIVIFVIILTMLCSCSKVRPYSSESVFTNNYPYEGFSTLDYLNKDNSNDSVASDHLINQGLGDCKKVQGFDGLFCKPFVADNKIDKFADAQGDPKNFGKSSGLSNSKGGLILGNDLTRLLQTRGGNQTGGPDQI
jgi:hypothetical protein|uniref:Uncharacterized protein n=1 Tax=viral metagenome TaxID=1070528 RepID=A0A6C0JLS2_9ZZZZ